MKINTWVSFIFEEVLRHSLIFQNNIKSIKGVFFIVLEAFPHCQHVFFINLILKLCKVIVMWFVFY